MNAPLVSTIVTTEQHVLTLPARSSVHVKKDTRGTEYVAQVIYLVMKEKNVRVKQCVPAADLIDTLKQIFFIRKLKS